MTGYAFADDDQGWHGSASGNIALIQAAANTRTVNVTTTASKKVGTRLTTADATYIGARQRPLGSSGAYVTTDDSAFMNGKHTYRIGDKLDGFYNMRLQTDRIQSLQLRSILGGGVSYLLAKSEGFSFRGSAGLAWTREDFRTQATTSALAGQFGWNLEKLLGAKLRFTHDFTIFPDLKKTSDHYYLAQFGLEQTVAGNFFYNVRYILDKDTTPAPGVPASTNRLLFGVGTRF